MGGCVATAAPAAAGNPYGIVAGPFVGDPVTCLDVVEADGARGDILVGRATGKLRMYRHAAKGRHPAGRGRAGEVAGESAKGKKSSEGDVEGQDSRTLGVQFREQPPLPSTDGTCHFISGYKTAPIVKSGDSCIKGAFCDGESVYALVGNRGLAIYKLSRPDDIYELNFEANNSLATQRSTYSLQYKSSAVRLCAALGMKGGAILDGQAGTTGSIVLGDDHGQLPFLRGHIPCYIDGSRIVVSRTTHDREYVAKKTRSVTIFDGLKLGGDEGVTAADISLQALGSRMGLRHAQQMKENPAEDLREVCTFDFEMPLRRVIWGFQLSEKYFTSVHDDAPCIYLWHIKEDSQDDGPVFKLSHSSRVISYNITPSSQVVSICSDGHVYLWSAGRFVKRMMLPSAPRHSFLTTGGMPYWTKYRCGIVVYNDDSYVYAARLESDDGSAGSQRSGSGEGTEDGGGGFDDAEDTSVEAVAYF